MCFNAYAIITQITTNNSNKQPITDTFENNLRDKIKNNNVSLGIGKPVLVHNIQQCCRDAVYKMMFHGGRKRPQTPLFDWQRKWAKANAKCMPDTSIPYNVSGANRQYGIELLAQARTTQNKTLASAAASKDTQKKIVNFLYSKPITFKETAEKIGIFLIGVWINLFVKLDEHI